MSRVWQHRPNGSLAIVYGRRRLGKTFLLQRFFTEPDSRDIKVVYSLANQTTSEIQRLELAERLLSVLPDPLASARELAVSWNSLFRYASQQATKLGSEAKVALVLDEFPYLVDKSPELPSVLQSWWDMEGAHSPISVVLCGSQLSVMAALGEASAPLHGRFNAGRHLISPMRYDDVGCFYEGQDHFGVKEKLVMFGALGGNPRYHAMVRPERSMEDELVDLLFRPRSPLADEVRYLLSSEHLRDVAVYQAILGVVAMGRNKRSEISSAIGIAENKLTHALNTMIELDWIARERPFGETSDSRNLYRSADPFVSFYYRFVARNASAIQFNDPKVVFERNVAPYLSHYMGQQVFESVCGQWLRKRAVSDLQLAPTDIGRWWSRDSQVEIDIIAPLEGGGTLFGECKWGAAGLDDLNHLRAKVANLPHSGWKRDSRYVIFSAGQVSSQLQKVAEADPAVKLVDGSMLF